MQRKCPVCVGSTRRRLSWLVVLLTLNTVWFAEARAEKSIGPDESAATISSLEPVPLTSAPDKDTAGIFNTELAPAGTYQADFTTGHLWYGISPNTNVFTNMFANALVIGGKPTGTLGGKTRYCSGEVFSCSLLIELGSGLSLSGGRRKLFGGLLQNSVALDLRESGRFILGAGAFFYAERDVDVSLNGFENRFLSWGNLLYDFPISNEWSIGVGAGTSVHSLHQYHVSNAFWVNRIGFKGTQIYQARTQISIDDWHLAGGLVAVSMGGKLSVLPMIELVLRRSESLFTDDPENADDIKKSIEEEQASDKYQSEYKEED